MTARKSRDRKHDLFARLTKAVARQMKRRGISEQSVLADFERWRKGREYLEREVQSTTN
jgi:hypothetical protein